MAYHHACRILESLKLHPQLELFVVPPYSPYLIAVERAWWYVRRKITHSIYVKQLKQRKPHFWEMSSHFQKSGEELRKVYEVNF